MAARAVDHRALQAHLRPARTAVLAGAAAVVVVVHHALADPGLLLADARAHRRDDAAGLVPGDHAGLPLDAARHCPVRLSGRAISVQIAAAHPGSLDLQDHVPRTRGRIGELPQLQPAVSEKHDALHGFLRIRADLATNISPCGADARKRTRRYRALWRAAARGYAAALPSVAFYTVDQV